MFPWSRVPALPGGREADVTICSLPVREYYAEVAGKEPVPVPPSPGSARASQLGLRRCEIPSAAGPAIENPARPLQSPMSRLQAEVFPQSRLSAPLVEAMFELYTRYFDATGPELFRSDLDGKDWVLLMKDREGRLRGFSTLALLESQLGGSRVRALFSGDTIVDHRHWGQQALAFTWIRFAGVLKAQAPEVPLYWFLVVKGQRTYRYLEAFARSYYPHWARPTPAPMQSLMDHLARERFGSAYQAGLGVLRFESSRGHLKPVWAQIPVAERERPEVAYFLRRNPGYVRGEELVCLTELCAENLRPLARRLFLQGSSD